MKTNKNKSSHRQRSSVSSDIQSITNSKASPPEIRRSLLTKAALPPTPGARYQIDSTCLDIHPILPGALQELGQAYLNILVDSATGRIVDAIIHFDADRVAPGDARCSPYRPQIPAAAERALCRLLRHHQSN